MNNREWRFKRKASVFLFLFFFVIWLFLDLRFSRKINCGYMFSNIVFFQSPARKSSTLLCIGVTDADVERKGTLPCTLLITLLINAFVG